MMKNQRICDSLLGCLRCCSGIYSRDTHVRCARRPTVIRIPGIATVMKIGSAGAAPGSTCEGRKPLNADDAASNSWLNSHTQRCPDCARWVQKVDRCDHMRCVCRFEFCYECRADYRNIHTIGNKAHSRECPYYG
jgi:hypothetical protein